MNATNSANYTYKRSGFGCEHAYLLPALDRAFSDFHISPSPAFDLGCGNGCVANGLAQKGFQVAGVDPSITGIERANRDFPSLPLRVGSAYDPLHEQYGVFPLVVCLEVVEHVYAPRDLARCIRQLLAPGGFGLISTPYHGYWKNLALALAGRLDDHFTALWDHGHIKFWSPRTLAQLLTDAGLTVRRIYRVGRIPALAKSMLLVVQ